MSDTTQTELTPEQHTNDLIAGIDRELDRFGAVSLADFAATVISARFSNDQPDSAYWEEVCKVFEDARDEISTLNERFNRPRRRPYVELEKGL